MPYTPHTPNDIHQMLEPIGIDNVEQLFDEIPADIRVNGLTELSDGINELAVSKYIQRLTQNDHCPLNFIGAGAYQHHIPAAVWDIASRGEFLTAYTPYQAEASQGSLQLIFEFQTMIASLCGSDIANASMYDGASAFAEAILMAVRANKKRNCKKILIADCLHPHYLEVANSMTAQQGIELISFDCQKTQGKTELAAFDHYGSDELAAVVIPQPNFLGQLTLADQITDWAHQRQALVIAVVNPTALALIKEPGSWGKMGADIICGEGQPLGIPMASGGPYFGFMSCKTTLMRQLPGRIVGQTTDSRGNKTYCLTLQAREQHIRRSKATSNICTNQGLMVTAATIYMSLLGAVGLKKVALQCHHNARQLQTLLANIKGIRCLYPQNFFHEFVIELPHAADEILAQLAQRGIAGGYSLAPLGDNWRNCLLICSTEVHDQQDLEQLPHHLNELLNN